MSILVRSPDPTSHPPLDPRILQALHSFLKRHNLIDALRGICFVILTFLLCFGVVATIDYFWLVDDFGRLLLSIAAYAITIGVGIVMIIRPILRKQPLDAVAVRFERAEPKLRNHLLSAVELGDGEWEHEPVGAGSYLLRQLLQRRVGNFIAGIDIAKLIPVSTVQPWLNIALAMLLMIVLGIVVPGSPLGLLYARALAPMANLARASSTKITLLTPDTDLHFVPANEVLLVAASIEGLDEQTALLEIRDSDQSRPPVSMQLADAGNSADLYAQFSDAFIDSGGNVGRLFHCNLEVEETAIEFRIIAGDAITAWIPVEPKLRPAITQFTTTIEWPEYAKLAPHTITAANPVEVQAISVLKDSNVAISIATNQPTSTAEVELVWSSTDAAAREADATVSLQRLALEEFAHAFGKVTTPLQFRMHFSSLETGFKNTFPPTHSIQVIEDTAPIARIDLNGAASTTAVARDLLPLKAEVRDELPVDQIVLQYAINDQAWSPFPEELALIRNEEESNSLALRMVYAAKSELDLALLPLKEGDLLRLRLEASDRKGQMSRSNEAEVLITANYFTPERYDYLNRRAEWLRQVNAWSDPASPTRDNADLLKGTQQLLMATTVDVDAIEVEAMGRAILAVEQRGQELLGQEPQAQSNPEQTSNEKKQLRSAASWYFAFTVNDSVARDIEALHAVTDRMRSAEPGNSDAWNQRQLQILAWNYKSCLAQYAAVQNLLPDSTNRALSGIVSQLQQYLDRIESLLADEPSRQRIRDEQNFQHQQLGNYVQNPLLDGGLFGNAIDGLRHSYQLRRSAAQQLEKIALLVNEQNSLQNQLAKIEDAAQGNELQERLLENNNRFKQSITELSSSLTNDHAVHQSRTDVDPTRLADLDLIQQAISVVLRGQVVDYEPHEAFKLIGTATGVLSAGYEANQYERLLRSLAVEERWNKDRLTLRLMNPRRWDYWGRGMELTVAELRSTTVPPEVTNALDQLRYLDPASSVGRTVGNRRWDKNWKSTASDGLDRMLANYVQRKKPLDQAMNEARELLRNLLPEETNSNQSRRDQQQELAAEETDNKTLASLPTVDLNDLLKAAEEMSAEQLLKKLEEDLKNEPPMQDELARISDQILQDAIQQLERAAQDEYDSERSLEQSDNAVREEKELAVRQLQDLAQQLDQVRSQLAQQAKSVAARGVAKDAIEPLTEAEQLLQAAANEARRASSSLMADEIAEQADKANEMLMAAEERLKAAASAAERVQGNELEKESDRSRTRDQMESLQKNTQNNLARSAEQRERQWRQLQKQFENQTNNAARQKQNARDRLEKAQQAAEKKPDDVNLQQAVAEAQKGVERADDQHAVLSEMKDRAEELAGEAKRQAETLRQSPQEPLQANNPAAELAQRLSAQGAAMAAELGEKSQQIKAALANQPGIQAEQGQLAATAEQQSQLQNQINQVADSLERAARHEQRLGSDPTSASLQQAAESIRQLAEGAIASAQQSAAQASTQLADSNQRASSPEQGREVASRLADAQQAIRQGLQELEAVAADLPTQTDQTSSTDSSAIATLKARALDDLDRALNTASPAETPSNNMPIKMPTNALAQSPTLTQAKAEQASAATPSGTLDAAAVSQPLVDTASENTILESMEDWGELREQKADEVTEGKRTAIPRKYQRQIEAYFRSISEKAKQ